MSTSSVNGLIALTALMCLLAFVGSGCGVHATGQSYEDFASTMPPIPVGQGRFYLYREKRHSGSAIVPSVFVNDEFVGEVASGGFIMVDLPAGLHVIKSGDAWLRAKLQAGQTRYVEMIMYPVGLLSIYSPRLILVQENQALRMLESLRLIERPTQ